MVPGSKMVEEPNMIDFILQYAPIVITVGLIVFLLDRTLGRFIDRITRRREAIQSEAEKHMDAYLKELGR